MLRESTVAYSSLPLDEGSTSSTTFVTTRPTTNPHIQRDCYLTAIITALVITCGLSVAVIVPLALKYRTEASGRGEFSGQLAGLVGNITNTQHLGSSSNLTHEQGSSSNISITHQQGSSSNISSTHQQGSSSNISSIHQQGSSSNLTDSQQQGSFNTTIAAPDEETSIQQESTKEPDTTTTTTTTTTSTTPKKATVHSGPPKSLEGTGSGQSGETSKALGNTTASHPAGGQALQGGNISKPGVSAQNVSKEDILNSIYGSGDRSTKPSTTKGLSEWMNEVMARHDPATLVVMAVVVAVAGAAVLVAVSWLVLGRINAHRRRINIQNVITDLQTRDKIVLLNSEESEEE